MNITQSDTPVILKAGDDIQLDAGVTITAAQSAISGGEDATGVTMNLAGTVQAAVAIESDADGQMITIASTGSILGTFAGILLKGNDNVVDNYGSISAVTGVDSAGILAQSFHNDVMNAGTITGDYGIILAAPGSDTVLPSKNSVVNSGTIEGMISGVALWGDGSSLDNSNIIKGSVAVDLFGTGQGTITIKNTGTIESLDVVAIAGSAGADLITNDGLIKGYVNLEDGDDTYDGRNGSVAFGSVNLGTGDDVAYGGSAPGLFYGGEGNDTLTGGNNQDRLEGDDGNDTLEGGQGDDFLYGGEGIDTAVFSGSDPVQAKLHLNLAIGYGSDVLDNIENLVGGSGNDLLEGDDFDNALTGGDGDDVLDGRGGFDTAVFSGSVGATADLTKSDAPQDTQYGQDTLISIENLTGGQGADKFTGDGGDNRLTGNKGDDVLDGGLGGDVLDGGAGSDTALYNGAAAATVNLTITTAQNTGYGADTLTGIENLIGGTGADRFTGSDAANRLIGDAGNDTLDGGFGNDELNGGDGIDTVAFSGLAGATVDLEAGIAAGYGIDALISIENLHGGSGSDSFTGSSAANLLLGGDGGDLLNGGLGNDTLDGGAGLDVVRFTGSAGATVNLALTGAQKTGYGQDIILGVEALWGGMGADRFTGNSGNNAFIGEAGRDTISGAGGHDTIAGGLGNDRLTGGSGKDLFVFDTRLDKSANVDTVTDFRRVDDGFRLENSIFKKLAKVGALNKANLALGAKAKDKNDYIVYDKTKGVLSYDADGSGKGAAVKFAQLTKGTILDHKDFFII